MRYSLTIGSVTFQSGEFSVELRDVRLDSEPAFEDFIRYLDAVSQVLETLHEQASLEPVSTLN